MWNAPQGLVVAIQDETLPSRRDFSGTVCAGLLLVAVGASACSQNCPRRGEFSRSQSPRPAEVFTPQSAQSMLLVLRPSSPERSTRRHRCRSLNGQQVGAFLLGMVHGPGPTRRTVSGTTCGKNYDEQTSFAVTTT